MGIDTFGMIFKRYIIIFIIVLQAVSTVEAQDGTTAYEFLNVSASSHVYALGGTNITTIDDDVNLIDQNPGLLGPEYEMQAGLNYMRYLGGSNFMGARFTAPAGDHAAWAVGIHQEVWQHKAVSLFLRVCQSGQIPVLPLLWDVDGWRRWPCC